jgi:hypothetical protein
LHDLRVSSTGSSFTGLPVSRPSRLRRFAHHAAPFFGANVSPTRRAETDGGSLNRLGRELSTGEVEDFDRQVEEDFRR